MSSPLGVGLTLHHVRRRLPADVRVTDPTHALAGQVLRARHVYRRYGQIFVVVVLADNSVTSVPVESTDVIDVPPREPVRTGTTVLSLAGVRRLLSVLERCKEVE